jgi:uncharacterized iron-regulated membrane protein
VSSTTWQRWLWQPQRVWLRKAVFQVHLWSGIGLGLYVLFISVTGSVLVYRNEMYMAATPEIDIPPGGEIPVGIRFVSGLIELHDNFLVGDAGKAINGVGAIAVLLVAVTGLVIWWPGFRRWRRSLSLRRGVGWKRFIWDLHSALGFWSFALIVMFALSGVYLCFPESFHAAANRISPYDPARPEGRLVDDLLYWLAFLHFGRINGIGIPCDGPGVCDQTVKALWAVFGLTPAAMFVTGSIMWWNRVVRRWRRKALQRL